MRIKKKRELLLILMDQIVMEFHVIPIVLLIWVEIIQKYYLIIHQKMEKKIEEEEKEVVVLVSKMFTGTKILLEKTQLL